MAAKFKIISLYRLDIARAANHLMRMALEGRITLSFRPPDYNQETWENHKDIAIIEDVVALHKIQINLEESVVDFSDSSSSEEEDVMKIPIVATAAKNKFRLLNMGDE